MDKIVVEGGARLVGKIPISGAKNAALPLLAAALLPSGRVDVQERPAARRRPDDGEAAAHARLGRSRRGDSTRSTIAPPTGKKKPKLEAPYDLVKTMRASVLVLGPLVARYGRARVSMPGGCAIGARPIDQHLKGLEAMGAKVTLDARLRRRRGASGCKRRDDRARHADGDRLREPHDGGGAREGPHRDRERRARARGRGARRSCSTRWARRSRAPARRSSRSRASTSCSRSSTRSCRTGSRRARSRSRAAMTTRRRAARGRAARAPGRGRSPSCARWARRSSAEAGGLRVQRRRRHQAGRHHDPAASRVSDRHAGAVHGAGVHGEGPERDQGDDLREPLHARARARPHGRGHPRSSGRAAVDARRQAS